MLTKLSISAINLYQRYLSPHKGYCCAHRVYTGEDSCSQYAKVAIAEYGLFSAFPLIREQFDRCSLAAKEMKKQRKKKGKDNTSDDCAGDIACQSINCVPQSCFSKKSSSNFYDNCDIGGCDNIGDCHPFH